MNKNHRDWNLLIFLTVFILGVLSLLTSWLLHYEPEVMNGIASGCIPTGALGTVLSVWVSRWADRKHPDWQLKERDERNAYIRHRAGYTAFWALFPYFFIYTLLSPTRLIQGISHTWFGISVIIIMGLAYFTAVYIYSRIY